VYDYDTDKSLMTASKIKVNVGIDPDNPLQAINVQQVFLAPIWLSKGDYCVWNGHLHLPEMFVSL
jgi:hypothetical protein